MLLGLAIMVVGAFASVADVLPIVLAATALMVFGFFGTHAVASGFVGGWAEERRAQASALYLFGYHLESSVAGFVGGVFFARYGWSGEVGTVLVLLAIGLVATSHLPKASGRQVGSGCPGRLTSCSPIDGSRRATWGWGSVGVR